MDALVETKCNYQQKIKNFSFSVDENDYSKMLSKLRKILFEHNYENVFSDRIWSGVMECDPTVIGIQGRELQFTSGHLHDSYYSNYSLEAYKEPFFSIYLPLLKMTITIMIHEVTLGGTIDDMIVNDPLWDREILKEIVTIVGDEMIATETTTTTIEVGIPMIMINGRTVTETMKIPEPTTTQATVVKKGIMRSPHFVSDIYKFILELTEHRFFTLGSVVPKSSLFSLLDVRTKYVWDSDAHHTIIHTRQMQNQEVCLHYDLCVRPNSGDTTLVQYNNSSEWNDTSLFHEIFRCPLQAHVKAKVVTWLESSGATPETVRLRKQGTQDFVAPTQIKKGEMVTGVEFTNIINALVFQIQNTDRIPYEESRFLYWKVEWAQNICCQTRPTIGNQIAIVLPNLPELKEILRKSREHFAGGASSTGKATPPIRHQYDIELDDLRKLHEKSYIRSTKKSDVLDGAPVDHMFVYSDIKTSDVMITSSYLADNKFLAPPASQQAKLDHVRSENNWDDDDFQGQYFMFTRQGKAFRVRSSSDPRPIIHQCKTGRWGCPVNCKSRGKADFAAIPTWSSAFHSAALETRHSIEKKDIEKLYTLFRQFKFDFIVKIMKIESAEKEKKESPEVQTPSTNTTRSHTSLATLLSNKSETGSNNEDAAAGGKVNVAETLQDMITIKTQMQKMFDDNKQDNNKIRQMFSKHKDDQKKDLDDYKNKLNKNFGNMNKKLNETANLRTGAILDIINTLASKVHLNDQRLDQQAMQSRIVQALMMNPDVFDQIIEDDDQAEALMLITPDDAKKDMKALIQKKKEIAAGETALKEGKVLVTTDGDGNHVMEDFSKEVQMEGRHALAVGIEEITELEVVKPVKTQSEAKDLIQKSGMNQNFATLMAQMVSMNQNMSNNINTLTQNVSAVNANVAKLSQRIPNASNSNSNDNDKVSKSILLDRIDLGVKNCHDAFFKETKGSILGKKRPPEIDTMDKLSEITKKIQVKDTDINQSVEDLDATIKTEIASDFHLESTSTDSTPTNLCVAVGNPDSFNNETVESIEDQEPVPPIQSSSSPKKEEKSEADSEEDKLLQDPIEPEPSTEPLETGRAGNTPEDDQDEENFEDHGVRPVGKAYSLRKPSIPSQVEKTFDVKIAQIVSAKLKDPDATGKMIKLANELNIPLEKCKKSMWYRSPHLKNNSSYFKVEPQHRWLARLYQYCQPIHLQQFVTTIYESYKGRKDLDGMEQNLFWESEELLSNIKLSMTKMIPHTIYKALTHSACEDNLKAWQVLNHYPPFDISSLMMDRYEEHLEFQLTKGVKEYTVTVFDEEMEESTRSYIFPEFTRDTRASAGMLRDFIKAIISNRNVIADKKLVRQSSMMDHFQRAPSISSQSTNQSSQPSSQSDLIKDSQPEQLFSAQGVINFSVSFTRSIERVAYNYSEFIIYFSNEDYQLLLSYHNSTAASYTVQLPLSSPKLFEKPSSTSPVGKVRAGDDIQYSVNPIDFDDEHSLDSLSTQEISPKKALNPNAKPFVPNVWNNGFNVGVPLYYESSISSVSTFSTDSSSEPSDNLSFSSVSSMDMSPPVKKSETAVSCPYGHHCILSTDQHYFNFLHPDDDGYIEVPKLECDLGKTCPYKYDIEHMTRYSHPKDDDSNNPDSFENLKKYLENDHPIFIPSNTRNGRILQKRYAEQGLLYPGINSNDEFMLSDSREQPHFNKNLRKEVLELSEKELLNPLLPIDHSMLPKKFETRKMFELRKKSEQDLKEWHENKKSEPYLQSLYDSSNPTQRIRERLLKEKQKKKEAKERREKQWKGKRKDFSDLKILYTNLNNPMTQITDLFYWYGTYDIIVLTELDVDISFFEKIGIYNRNFVAYTHKGNKIKTSDGRTESRVYSAILINKTKGFLVKVKYEKIPFISLYITVPSKNKVPLSFNICAFYKFHCGPKSRSLRLHSNLDIDNYFLDALTDIHRLQIKVPSLLLGDVNNEIFTPRKQDSKYLCREIRTKFGNYTNELGKHPTNIPSKRKNDGLVQPSQIDCILSKNFRAKKVSFENGRSMISNDGHMCITCIFDVPLLEQNRLKTIKVKHFPDKDIVYNHAYKIFSENERELEELFDHENLLRQNALNNPDWTPPKEAGRYSQRVYEILNQIANETILEEEKTVDLSRSRSAISPISREVRKEVSKLGNRFIQTRKPLPTSVGEELLHMESYLKRFKNSDIRNGRASVKSDFENLKENDIFFLHQKYNSVMRLQRDKEVIFGVDQIGKHFTNLQEMENMDDVNVELWKEIPEKQKFDPTKCQLYIQGKDTSDSIIHIISKLKEKTMSHNTFLCRKILSGMPRNLVGMHLVRSIRLDTELGIYNPLGKTNKLIKLHKAGKKYDSLDGYRCIQVPQLSAQITDCWLINNLSDHLSRPPSIISSNQNGFRKNYSCATAGACIYDAVNHNQNKKSLLIMIDFRNAFGSVNHKILTARLKMLVKAGVDRLIRDQLTGRYVVVHENGETSDPFPIPNVGVPQGSNGGPIMFNIYIEIIIDFLKKYPNVLSILFADDTCLHISAASFQEGIQIAEKLLTEMVLAASQIGININAAKSEFMTIGKDSVEGSIQYTVNGQTFKISQASSLRYLGFYFDTHLGFSEHFGHIMKRLYTYRPLICNMLKVGNMKETSGLAYSLLYGVIQYGMEIIPLGTPSDYAHLNLAIVSIGCDMLNIRRYENNKKVQQSSIFHAFRWMESSNLHKLAICRFTNRIMTTNRPEILAERLKSILVYKSDSQPYIWPDFCEDAQRLIAERRQMKRDVPFLKINNECPPKYPHLYPYNLKSILQELPSRVAIQLGSDSFKISVENHFKNRCQHAVNTTAHTCTFCLRRKTVVQYKSDFVQPIHKSHDQHGWDVCYFGFQNNKNLSWGAVKKVWSTVLNKWSKVLNVKLQSLNFIRPIKFRSS